MENKNVTINLDRTVVSAQPPKTDDQKRDAEMRLREVKRSQVRGLDVKYKHISKGFPVV